MTSQAMNSLDPVLEVRGRRGQGLPRQLALNLVPPLVMFAIQHSTRSYTAMVSSRAFGVSLLRDTQAEVASLFATKGPEKTGKTISCDFVQRLNRAM